MKILVTSINFHPDHSGIALYSTDLPTYFAEQGHDVTMVTGFPYYPKWKKNDSDKFKLFRTEVFKKVKVLRGYLYVPHKVSTLARIIHEISFLVSAFVNFIRAGRHDCIVILSPPLLLGLIGTLFKKIWKAKLIFHIQDLQPDAALSLGMVKENIMIKALKKAEMFIYRKSDLVATITDCMYERLIAKGIPKQKLEIYYNWIDVKAASHIQQKGKFIGLYPTLLGKFIVAYAGNVGVKQGLDVLIDLAEATANYKQLQYLIIGEGADRDRLVDMASKKGLINLTFINFLNQEHYFEMLDDIDVSFISQRSKAGNLFFPSKILGIMAKSKPLLISADLDSELASVVNKAKCGYAAEYGDINKLQEYVCLMYTDRNALLNMGINSYSWVQRYDRNIVLSSFLSKIVLITKGSTL